jgi:hypothetical protein
MSRSKRWLNRCPAGLSWEEAVYLTALGGKPRAPSWYDDQPEPGRVVVDRVLCWWCRKYHHPGEVERCMALERPVPLSGGDSTSSLIAKMPEWLSPFPELWEFLSKPLYKDGTPRQMGKVSLCLVSGGIQVTLTDPSSSTYCSRQYKNLEDALLELEVGLERGTLSWRASGPLRAKKGR